MGISYDARADSDVLMLTPGEKANTSAATSTWFPTVGYKGDIAVTAAIGAVTAGSITGKLRTATASNGTGAADIAGATFTAVEAADKVQTVIVPGTAVGKYIQYVGTIDTGPVVVSVTMRAHPGTAG
jgi:hypothetical protein